MSSHGNTMTQQQSSNTVNNDEFSRLFKGSFPYNKQLYSNIVSRRQEMNGQLFFDLLVGAIEHRDEEEQKQDTSFSDADEIISLYPPKNEPMLHELYLKIRDSEQADPVKRGCLIFYLLLDLETPDTGSKFAKAHCIPEGYVKTVTGFHQLDNGAHKQALKDLTHVSTRPQYPEKVLETFAKTVSDETLRSQYIYTYVNSTQCALNTQDLVNIYFTAVCTLPSPLGALEFIQACTADIRADLLTQLVRTYLGLNGHSPRKDAALLLANLSFSSQEQSHVYQALTEILHDASLPQKSRTTAARILLVRHIHLGDLLQARALVSDITAGVFKNLSESDFSSSFIPDWHDLQNAIDFTIPSAC